MQQGDAGPDGDLGLGEAVREAAEVFYSEGLRNRGVVYREADLFPGFAAGDFVCSFGKGRFSERSASWEGR